MPARDLKPRTVGELLDAAFFVYRRHFTRLVLIAMTVSLPALVVAAFYAGDAAAAVRSWWDQIAASARHNQGGDVFRAFDDSMRAAQKIQPIALLQGVLQSFERAAGVVTMAVVAESVLRREAPPSYAATLRLAAARVPAAVLLQVVLDVVLGGCMVCPPVGILLTALVACAPAAIANERGALEMSARRGVPVALRWAVLPFAIATDGVGRSLKLSADGVTLARGATLLFFLLLFVGVVDGVAMGLGAAFGGRAGAWFWAQHCSEALALPVWGLGVSFWFADLRARREGADLGPAA